jgi:hypothetical protein
MSDIPLDLEIRQEQITHRVEAAEGMDEIREFHGRRTSDDA